MNERYGLSTNSKINKTINGIKEIPTPINEPYLRTILGIRKIKKRSKENNNALLKLSYIYLMLPTISLLRC